MADLEVYDYNPAILANVCPVCSAAATGKCLVHTNRGLTYREHPHYPRVLLAVLMEGMNVSADEVLQSEEFRRELDKQID